MGTTRKSQKGDSVTERNRGVRVLNESYSGFIEKYNPFSELRGVEQVGAAGDEVEVHSWWRDLKRKETWVCVKIDGIQGWMLESETSPRPGE
jgi:hypothetical protein